MSVAAEGTNEYPHQVDDAETILDLHKSGGLDLATRLAIQAANASAEYRWDNAQDDIVVAE